MKRSLFFMFILIMALRCQAQEVDVQYLQLRDSSILQNIRKVIDENKNEPSLQFLKRARGYIILSYQDYYKKDTIGSYSIDQSINSLFTNAQKIITFFPLFYSFIDDRPVLIYLHSPETLGKITLSKKSKEKLEKLIEPFIEPKSTIEFKDPKSGKVFIDSNFRPYYISFYKEFRKFYLLRNINNK